MNDLNFYVLRRKLNSLCLMNDFNFYHGVLNHFYKFNDHLSAFTSMFTLY